MSASEVQELMQRFNDDGPVICVYCANADLRNVTLSPTASELRSSAAACLAIATRFWAHMNTFDGIHGAQAAWIQRSNVE